MISERRGDGEIRLGVESDMEIEEGEACFCHNGDDTSFDPDVSLSYIDDKIKDILGHFQKDFEGGVSAENLGAKFGGYGSFLPTYARSPAGSQRRTTSEVLDGNTHRSPRILDFEASHLSSLASSCSPLPLRLEGSTTNPNDLRSINGRVKREGRVPFNSVETPTSKVEQKSKLPYDQRTLKVRLKVGSNNLPARKIAEIYSGLGLDGSPSPSLNDSCTDGEGLSHDISDPSGNSPTSILKIMTSFLQGDQLLSPLSEELVHFTVKGKYSRESVCKPLHKKKVSGYDSRKHLCEPLPEKKTDSYENGEFLEEVKPSNGGFLLKRETDIDDLACEDLVTNALKLPLLSNTKPGPPRYAEGTVNTADLPRASNEGPSSMTQAEEQTLEYESIQEIERIQKPKGNVGLSGNTSIPKKENVVDNCNVAKKPSKHKEKRNIVSGKVESGLPVQERAPGDGLFDSRETKIIQADVFNNEVTGNQSQGEEQLGASGRKKLEGGQSHDSLNNFESCDNGSHVNILLPKNVSGNTSKGLKKITNKYAEFFGDLDFEQDDIKVPSKELSSVKTGMDSKLEENGSTLADTRIAKETSSGRKNRKPNKAEEYPRASSKENASSIAAGFQSDAILSAPAPELEDNWVLCDKCQKWRLLPLGRNPSSLPEKWMCKMLDWLPAMNRCTFSEEETTNAVRALYQVPAPLGAEGKPPGHTGTSLSMISSTGVSNSAHNRRMLDQQTSQTGVDKKHKSKYEPGRPVYAEPLQHSKSMKNHEEKNNSLVGMNHSSQVDSYGNPYVGQPSSSFAEKHANKVQKENSVEVDAKKLKARKRGLSDSDSSRSSKKVKSQDGHCLGHSSPEHIPRKDKRTIDGRRKEVNDEFRNHVAATEITYDASLPDYKGDGKSSSKKNKAQGEQGTRSYVGNITQAGHQSLDRSGDTERKVKKARLSNSEGKDATTKKATSDSGRKDIKSIDQQIGRERGSSGKADSSKRDLGSVHPSVPSTSSSSKVSGSCKIKMNRLKVKGSPVESVSSSPLRVLSSNNCALTSGNPQEKDDRDHIFVDNCSPRGSLVVATNKINHSTSGTKVREENRSSSDYTTQPVNEAGGKSTQDSCKNRASERYQDERKEGQTLNSGFHSRKLENGMSLHGNYIISENGKAHVASPVSNKGSLDDIPLSNEKFTGGRSRFQESSVSFDKDEKNFISEKSSRGKDLGGISDHENKSAPGCNVHSDDKLDEKEIDRDGQDSSNKLFSDIRNASDVSDSGKAHSLPPSTRYKNDRRAHHSQVPASHEENGVDIAVSDAHGDTSKAFEHNKKGEKQNGSTPSRHKVRDHDGSAVRKDSRSQAATTAMKEAKDLKRLADRFKNSGSADSTGMYFEAALKFLHGASLLECGSRENNKHNDMQSIDMYRSTAKFCEFCAHEYERSKDMASAALAYKCMEVSYMRVIYASHGNTSRDRNEVQMALQIVPPGESPASSVSDVDNLNNPVIVDKVSASKGMSSPQVAGSTGITARNRSCFTRLLEFAQDVSAAMDAARKSRATLAAANFRSGDANCGDGFSSVKRALDFDFQDVEGLLRLIRIAKDAVSR